MGSGSGEAGASVNTIGGLGGGLGGGLPGGVPTVGGSATFSLKEN